MDILKREKDMQREDKQRRDGSLSQLRHPDKLNLAMSSSKIPCQTAQLTESIPLTAFSGPEAALNTILTPKPHEPDTVSDDSDDDNSSIFSDSDSDSGCS
jgi:hypothetical protein